MARTGRRLSHREAFLSGANMKKDFRKTIAEEVLLADGAIGTLLTSRGASPDQARSPLNLSDPDSVREVHDDYVGAGARIITTNTWDANRVKLTVHEWADSLEKINREGARLAREAAAGESVFVAGSIGPLGALVKPYGSLHLTQVREIFEEQARVLLECRRRPHPAGDLRQPARGGRGGARRARPLLARSRSSRR